MGFDSCRNHIITLSAFFTNAEHNIQSEFHGRFRPMGKKEVCWSDKAQEVHGISWEEAMEFPPAKQTAEEYCHHLSKLPPHAFIAHNTPYDKRMILGLLGMLDLQWEFYRAFKEFQDTVKLVRDTKLVSSKSKSLGAICKELGIEHTHHDAASDAKVLIPIHKLCLQKQSEISNRVFRELEDVTA